MKNQGNIASPENNYSPTTKLLSREFCDPVGNSNSYFEETQWIIKKKTDHEIREKWTKWHIYQGDKIHNQTEILDLKNLMNEMKIAIENIYSSNSL